MTRTVVCLALALAACGSKKPAENTTASTGETAGSDTDAVDPTMPSWAPKSCARYHNLTVHYGDCQAAAQADRDAATKEYETRLGEWKALQNTEQSQLDAVKTQCDAAVTDLTAKLAAASCPG